MGEKVDIFVCIAWSGLIIEVFVTGMLFLDPLPAVCCFFRVKKLSFANWFSANSNLALMEQQKNSDLAASYLASVSLCLSSLLLALLHFCNYVIFRNVIGDFPLVMLTYNVLFIRSNACTGILNQRQLYLCPANNLIRFVRVALSKPYELLVQRRPCLTQREGTIIISALWIACQFIFPLRSLFMPFPAQTQHDGLESAWYKRGHRFSWTMMLHYKVHCECFLS